MALDVLIIGGGPAGCAAARCLASWGHQVLVVAAEAPPRAAPRALAVSIPPSADRLFAALGIAQAIDEAGFVRTTGNTVWWGADQPRVESFGDGRLGWQATTDRLERVLQSAAAAAGARIERRSIAAAEIAGIGAAFQLDCSGRAGVLARPLGVRRADPTLGSIALVAEWRYQAPGWIPDDTHTLIESYADGWAWSVPTAPRVRRVAVMVDPRTSDLARLAQSPEVRAQAREVYLAEIAKTRHLRALTSGGSIDAGPRGWDASMYGSSRYVDGRTLLVGDAGSFVDPLSSAGVRKALVSAWVAAIAVHTALVKPERREMALRFFDRREADLYAQLRRLTAGHLADAARGHGDPFWTERSLLTPPSLPSLGGTEVGGGGVPGVTEVGAEDAIRAAYDDLRRRTHVALLVAPEVRVESRPVIEGREIVEQPHLVTDRDPAPLRFLHDVELPALVEAAAGTADVGEMFDTYCRRCGPVALPQFLSALSTLVARGWLCYKDRTEGP